MTFATAPRSFGKRTLSIAELRARANRRAANREAFRDLFKIVVLPFLVASAIIYLGGF